MMTLVRKVVALSLLAVPVIPVFAQQASLSPAEVQKGTILLFDGNSLLGWSAGAPGLWRAQAGVLSADGSAAGFVQTDSPFADFHLKMDVQLANPEAAASVFFRSSRSEGSSADTGYRVSLGGADPAWPAGSIVHHFRSSASPWAAGQWHAVEIDAVGNRLTVLLDGSLVADGTDPSARAGYLGFRVEKGSKLSVRNIRLTPVSMKALLNGTDLTGWKSVQPSAAPNKPNLLQKMIPFGGKPKPNQSEWLVQNGVVRGSKGPGEIQSADMYADALVQFQTSAEKQPAAVYLRDDAGQAFSGYGIVVGGKTTGAIAPGLASPRSSVSVSGSVIGTAVISRRNIQVWINGIPVTEWTDTRPQGTAVRQNAKVAAGTIGLAMSGSTVSFSQISVATLPETLGIVHDKPAPPPPAPIPAPAVATPAVAAQMPANSAQPPGADADAKLQEQNREKSAALMSQALRSSDPAQQMQLYDQVIQLDPTNAGAVQGYKDARSALERQQQEKEKVAANQSEQQQAGNLRSESLQNAERLFLANHLDEADRQLVVAEHIAPADPDMQTLRAKITHARALRRGTLLLSLAGVLIILVSALAYWWLQSRKKNGYLQIVSGENVARRYELASPVVRIGSVAQDGGHRNDIVLADRERKLSRFHCQVHRDKNAFFIMDCNSTNGTRVDQVPLQPEQYKRLRNGAHIELGGVVTFRFGREKPKSQKS